VDGASGRLEVGPPGRPPIACARRCSRLWKPGAGSLSGLRFLDLYAGSGAVGLEAWSRGAGVVTLVEQDRRTAALIRANAHELGFRAADVVAASVRSTLATAPRAPFDVVYSDPPYPLADDAVAGDLAQLVANGWLVPDALVIVERSARGADLGWPGGLRSHRDRTYGDTRLWYGHASQHAADSQEDD
jgi:16S rRNA (guanine966-N2)-methyltransferase